MVIGFDGSRAFGKNRTGTENYSYQLLLNLAKIDQKNNYIVYVRPGTDQGTLWSDNFQFKVINLQRFWTQAGLSLQTFKDKLDVLFIPAHTLPIFYKPGLKTVVVAHDLGAEYLPKMHQLKQQLYLKWMTHRQLKNATRLIAVSKSTKQDLINRVGINGKNIKVVYEGFDEKLFKQVKSDLLVNRLKHYGLVGDSYFLFIGTVQPRKNLSRLIEAFAKYNQHFGIPKLVIAGGKGWLSDEIYALPKKLGIEDQVKFLGFVPDKDLPALYSGALALTYPSLFEGFGLPILEAQACGCPVLTSKISSMPEVAGKGAIYVDPYDINDIVEGMDQVKKRRKDLSKLGFNNIKRFSWEKCAKETWETLEDL